MFARRDPLSVKMLHCMLKKTAELSSELAKLYAAFFSLLIHHIGVRSGINNDDFLE